MVSLLLNSYIEIAKLLKNNEMSWPQTDEKTLCKLTSCMFYDEELFIQQINASQLVLFSNEILKGGCY